MRHVLDLANNFHRGRTRPPSTGVNISNALKARTVNQLAEIAEADGFDRDPEHFELTAEIALGHLKDGYILREIATAHQRSIATVHWLVDQLPEYHAWRKAQKKEREKQRKEVVRLRTKEGHTLRGIASMTGLGFRVVQEMCKSVVVSKEVQAKLRRNHKNAISAAKQGLKRSTWKRRPRSLSHKIKNEIANGRAVVDDDGKYFAMVTLAAKHHKIEITTAYQRAKNQSFGWRFANEELRPRTPQSREVITNRPA